MRIGWAFDSHLNMWRCPDLPKGMKRAKAAHLNKFGDLFWPKYRSLDPDDPSRYEPGSYKPPINGHGHKPHSGWHKDIRYPRYNGRYALLVGDPDCTFIWQIPNVYVDEKLPRNYTRRRWRLGDMLGKLKRIS